MRFFANWIRGVCQYGIMPSNGLVYSPPHQCSCFRESKLYAFWAIALASKSASNLPEPGPRLLKGPACETAAKTDSKSDPEGWPCIARDPDAAMRRHRH